MSEPNQPGVYETLITAAVDAVLADLPHNLTAERSRLTGAEAPDRIALHLARVIRRAVASLPETTRVEAGIRLARSVLQQLAPPASHIDPGPDQPLLPGELLTAVQVLDPDGRPHAIERPQTPLLDTTLLTNARGEPSLLSQLRSEADSALAIDVIMAFIRWSGIRPLLDVLQRHSAERGRPLRVLTTTYTGSTEGRALEALRKLGAEVRVSYDVSSTRLHAKAWLFHRADGTSTGFVGSSNLTHSASVSGLEWNLRLSGLRNPDVVQRIAAVFDSYWEGGEFVAYERQQFAAALARHGPVDVGTHISPIEVTPRPFQRHLLEQLRFSRARGHHRNLLVAATGTGKTVMAALDYRSLCASASQPRLLFVAHREEILQQSLATFRQVLQQPTFGQKWTGSQRPTAWEHVFASVQILNEAALARFAADHFAVVIVDEFHHAAARSYANLLSHFAPAELLGLTATPERTDGQDVLGHFGGRVAAELRLWDAIDQHYLVPFHYYGINDGTDLSHLPWRRGQGYADRELSAVYTGSDAWARNVYNQLLSHAPDAAQIQALGFCVDVDHARFMARFFESRGLPARAVDGQTPAHERRGALDALARGTLRVLFSVDLFNEGVDLPNVNTLLLLRPTQSALLFMQQLGRGLRRAPDKHLCTVLDFVGQQHREFRFDLRLRALLGGNRSELRQQVERGFPYLPSGCHMALDAVAQQHVLASLRQAIPSRWPQMLAELRRLGDVGLATFLAETGLEVEDVYAGQRCWSDLRAAAQLPVRDPGPTETTLRRAIGRLLHVDDDVRATTWGRFASLAHAPRTDNLSARDLRLLRMLVASLTDSVAAAHLGRGAGLQDGANLIWEHPQVLAELAELLPLLASRVDHLHYPLREQADNPLQVHARYTRIEMQAACDDGTGAHVPAWREGTKWLAATRTDLLAFTLDKTDGHFSPTTRYNDYALSEQLIHWESQSGTRTQSPTGQRYVHHASRDSTVLLFARLRQAERAFWFLGPATYRRHAGEQPMQVVWDMHYALPADLYARFRAVAD